MKLEDIESLYILKDTQRQELKKLEHCDCYFSMLRPKYLGSNLANAIMLDVFVFYFYEEERVIDTELELVYLLRRFVLDHMKKNDRLMRLKRYTIGSYTRGLLAAAVVTNIYLDIFEQEQQYLSEHENMLLNKYLDDSKMLFDAQFQQFSTHPSEFVKAETKLLQGIRKYLSENEEPYGCEVNEVLRFMDQYVLNEQDLFEKGLLN